MRQPRLEYLNPSAVIVAPKAIPIATRPTSPIQRLSKAYFKKNAVANRISTIAAQPIQRRPIIDSIQCKRLILKLSADFEPVSCEWKTRSKCFAEQLQSGDVFEAADVLKKLTFLSREKKLSFREQNLLEKSKFLIISEITNAEAADEEALRSEVERLVEKACNRHAQSQPKVMVASVH